MEASQAEQLRKAIESLIDAKLLDALSKPGGRDRLLAYRASGVAPFGVRMAQRKLQEALEQLPQSEDRFAHQAA
ncbi:MAG: hypothetical protein NZ561_01995 [Phycisphaerae bacterium]|nr:hypothetical protein [Phycisphaerae bacterium]MDW8261989.1 hypothetical protein [Phycisphaerales bacterium]